MLVRSRMTPDVLTVTPTSPLGEALRITRDHSIRHLPVIDENGLVGVVSDRDLRLAAPPVWATGSDYEELRQAFESKCVRDVMTVHAIVSTTEDTPIEDAARLLYEHRIGCLPVMRGNQLVGILTETDVMRAFVELFGTGDGTSRIEVRIPNRAGELARVVRAIGVDFKCNITGLVVPPIAGTTEAIAIVHVQVASATEIVEYLRKLGYRVGSPAIDLEPEDAHKRELEHVRPWGGDGF